MPNVMTALRLSALAALGATTLAAQTAPATHFATTVEMPAPVYAGAPSPDSLVHLVLARFATGSAAAFTGLVRPAPSAKFDVIDVGRINIREPDGTIASPSPTRRTSPTRSSTGRPTRSAAAPSRPG